MENLRAVSKEEARARQMAINTGVGWMTTNTRAMRQTMTLHCSGTNNSDTALWWDRADATIAGENAIGAGVVGDGLVQWMIEYAVDGAEKTHQNTGGRQWAWAAEVIVQADSGTQSDDNGWMAEHGQMVAGMSSGGYWMGRRQNIASGWMAEHGRTIEYGWTIADTGDRGCWVGKEQNTVGWLHRRRRSLGKFNKKEIHTQD